MLMMRLYYSLVFIFILISTTTLISFGFPAVIRTASGDKASDIFAESCERTRQFLDAYLASLRVSSQPPDPTILKNLNQILKGPSCNPCSSTSTSIQPAAYDRSKDTSSLPLHSLILYQHTQDVLENAAEAHNANMNIVPVADVICGGHPPPKCPSGFINTPQPPTTIGNWNYDPRHQLAGPHVNPELREHLHRVLQAVYDNGIPQPPLHFKIGNEQVAGVDHPIGVYRSPQESDEARANRQPNAAGQLPHVAPGWNSAHNYGTGVDLIVWNDKTGRPADDPTTYKLMKQLLPYMRSEGFESAEWPSVGNQIPNDDGHFEYHPGWPGLIGPANGVSINKIKAERDEAMRQAASEGRSLLPVDPASTDWLPYLWSRAGACPAVDVR
jgi:hypothetical protein